MLRSASIAGSFAALVLSATAAPALATARRGSVYGPASANRALAHREARRLLRALRLPGDAQRSAHPPRGTRGRLSATPVGPASAHLVDVHSYWRTYESPGAVLRYVAHHLPRGVELSTRSASGGSDGVGVLLWRLHPPPGLAMRAVAVSAVALAPGLTAVRLDAAARWLVPRPLWERVPAGAELATAAGHGARGSGGQDAGPQSRPAALTSAAARRLAGWIDRQPAAQPGIVSSCGFGAGQALTVRFLGAGGRLLAQATESFAGGCGALSLTVAGRTGPPLQDGGLQEELVRLHVITPCQAGELSVPPPRRGRASGEPALTFTLRDTAPAICTAAAIPTIALLGAGGRVLVGHDLHARAGPPAILYPETGESVVAELQACPGRPRALRARIHLAGGPTWSVPLSGRRPLRPCEGPLTLVAAAAG